MRGTAKYLTFLPILLCTILIIISCTKQETPTETQNHAPKIVSITSSVGEAASYRQKLTFTCAAVDDDNDQLEMLWSCNLGELTTNSGTTVEYTATVAGADTIKVSVSDGKNKVVGTKVIYIVDITVVPTMLSPLDKSVNIDTSPILIWKEGNAESYNLQVATDFYFKNLVYDEKGIKTTSRQVKELSPSTLYYWQVTYQTKLGSSRPPQWFRFTTISAPSLLTPADKSINVSTEPILSWTTGDPTNTYTLEVSTNENFSTIIYTKNGLTNKGEQVNGLQKGTTYYWRVTGTNTYGTKLTSSIFSFKTLENEVPDTSACKGIKQVSYEGKIYNTVAIGTQCWLKENLNVGKMVNGYGSNNGIIEKRCIGDIENNCEKYGGAYRWGEVFPVIGKVQVICPDGWHVPSIDEFKTLATSVNYDGNALKEIGQGIEKGKGTNTSGFSFLFAYGAGLYYAINGLWTSDYFSDPEGKPIRKYFTLVTNDNTVAFYSLDFLSLDHYGSFVRCVKD